MPRARDDVYELHPRTSRYITPRSIKIAGLFLLGMLLVQISISTYAEIDESTLELQTTFLRIEEDLIQTTDERKPEQVHIALAGEFSTDMRISWITAAPTASKVRYGMNPGQWDYLAEGTSAQYRFNEYTSGHIHDTLLPDLRPKTVYYYQCGDDQYQWSQTKTFKTVPSIGSQDKMSFGIIGDIGQTKFSEQTLRYLKKHQHRHIRAILHAGDLSYADGNQTRWDTWGRLIDPLASHIPWMVGPGNHEVEPSLDLKFFTAYQARFHMPYEYCNAPQRNLYYSFNVGTVHWIFITPYTAMTRGSKQYKWLEKDLRDVDREVTPWVLVITHAPFYNSNKAHQSAVEPQFLMKYEIEPILYKYRVDIVIAGHVHAYERSYPVYKGRLVPDAPAYIVIGDAGNREGLAREYKKEQPEWSAFRRARYGYAYLTVHNTTHAYFEWHEDDEDDIYIADSVWFVRSEEMRRSGASKYMDLNPAADKAN